MNLFDIENLPTLKLVALFAIAAHLCLMHVLVTAKAIRADFRKIFDVVARLAIHVLVMALQLKSGAGVMIETNFVPGCGNVTALAIEL